MIKRIEDFKERALALREEAEKLLEAAERERDEHDRKQNPEDADYYEFAVENLQACVDSLVDVVECAGHAAHDLGKTKTPGA